MSVDLLAQRGQERLPRHLAEIDGFGASSGYHRDVLDPDHSEDQPEILGRDITITDRRTFGIDAVDCQ